MVGLAGTGPQRWDWVPKRGVTWLKGTNSEFAHFVKSKQHPALDWPRAGKPSSTVSPGDLGCNHAPA